MRVHVHWRCWWCDCLCRFHFKAGKEAVKLFCQRDIRMWDFVINAFVVCKMLNPPPKPLWVVVCEVVLNLSFLLTQCISVWYSNTTNQDCKALQRVVRLAERISGSALRCLQDIYLKRCKSRAVKIIKDSKHPGKRLFILLPSGKRFRSMMAKTSLRPSGS